MQAPLGIIFKNENVNQEMHSILKQFHSYLPQQADGKVDGQIFSGDQLTVERAVNVIASVANGLSEHDRLEGMNFQIGDWHASVKLLSVSVSNVVTVFYYCTKCNTWLSTSNVLTLLSYGARNYAKLHAFSTKRNFKSSIHMHTV